MKQISFADAEFCAKKRVTRRERFLADMQRLVPWAALLGVLAPYYYPNSAGRPGRPPIALERMLRLYFVQQWFGLSDEGLEDGVYDSQALRAFVGIDLGRESVPDATTLLGFRHLLEEHALTEKLLETINAGLRAEGLLLAKGTLVDATLIAAPPSTKNRAKARDPQMHQSKKGNQWHFGMKAHIGVDADSGLVHTVHATAANVSDVSETRCLLHGQESEVYADAGYTGAHKREDLKERKVTWHIAMKRGKLKGMQEGELKRLTEQAEHIKAKIRARVEHPFHVVKNLFRHRKTRYKGLAKNAAQLHTLFALANLMLAKRALLA
jgi:IS5 family transposase